MRHRFAHDMSVRFADTDAQGHMFFANYFTFCDEALSAYMRAIGFPWQRLLELGVDMFYVNASCDFKGRARFETQLAVHARIGRLGTTSFTSEYAVYDGDGDAPIAEARLVSVCVTHPGGDKTRIPDELRDAVARYES